MIQIRASKHTMMDGVGDQTLDSTGRMREVERAANVLVDESINNNTSPCVWVKLQIHCERRRCHISLRFQARFWPALTVMIFSLIADENMNFKAMIYIYQ